MNPAEQAVLGAALIGKVAYPAILALRDDDFEDARHGLIASVIRDMIRARKTPDEITVAAELRAHGHLSKLPTGAAYLHDLTNLAPIPAAADYYARIVRSAARVRMLQAVTADMATKLADEQAQERLDELIAWHDTQRANIPGDLLTGTPESHSLTTLLEEPEVAEDWLIPGLLERGERVVITGGEGMAKSWIMRQLAFAVAAGVHPWTGTRVGPGKRVLHIDAENSRKQTRRGYRAIEWRTGRLDTDRGWGERITIHVRAEGLDLPGRDAGWLHQVAAECSPDLIVVGPAYKLMRGDPQRDSDVMGLLNVLDEVRIRHDAAVLVEHHTPHGAGLGLRPVRPYGSSVWLRWPEVGFGVRRDSQIPEDRQERRPTALEVVEWRGSREDRAWPTNICWGSINDMPWVPSYAYESTSMTGDAA